MPDQTSFLTFLVVALALNVAPGPDMIYVLARSIGQGRMAGVVSSLGIFVGCLFHITAAALGLAAVLRSSPLAFNIIRYAGAAYLVFLGIRVLLSRSTIAEVGLSAPPARFDHIFYQGVVTNVLNPKVAMFFLAFLPQFVNTNGNVALQVILLGMIFDTGGTLVNLLVAASAGHLGTWLRRKPSLIRVQKWLTACIFVGLGLRLGLARR